LKGGKGADRFICDKEDKIADYNSLENDIIKGNCEYEDKGVIKPEPGPSKVEAPKQIPKIKPQSQFPNADIPSNNDNSFKDFLSKLFDKNTNRIFP